MYRVHDEVTIDLHVRIRKGLHSALVVEARRELRSLNAEIQVRLAQTLAKHASEVPLQ
jgi:predicted HicB family RNase H-like nuclease